MTEEELKEKRKIILLSVKNRKVIKTGNHNLHGLRFCAVCGRPLVEYLPDNPDYKYLTTVKHFHYNIFDNLNGSMCYSIGSCRYYLKTVRKHVISITWWISDLKEGKNSE